MSLSPFKMDEEDDLIQASDGSDCSSSKKQEKCIYQSFFTAATEKLTFSKPKQEAVTSNQKCLICIENCQNISRPDSCSHVFCF